MRRELALWIAAAAVIGLAGFLGGRALKGGGPESFEFATSSPAYDSADILAGLSRAGFSGFDDVGGLAGSTLVSGKVTGLSASQISLQTASGAATIRLTGQEKLRILQPHQGSIAVGSTAVVLTDADAQKATAILLLLQP
jgi:hypothetical protein